MVAVVAISEPLLTLQQHESILSKPLHTFGSCENEKEELEEEEEEEEEEERDMMNSNQDERELGDEENDLTISDESMTPISSEGQVVIYESGKAILKVETGTTLEVVKLLYETETNNENNIIGVRPKSIGTQIPCIVTRQESKLEENAYDLIAKEKRPLSQTTPSVNSHLLGEQNGGFTSRCIDCSRESWKTKRYTNVGMNTEISINPLRDAETAHAITSTVGKHHQKPYAPNNSSVSSEPPAPPKRGRPPLQRAPTYSNIHHPKDYVVAALPGGAIPVPVNDMEFRSHYRHRSSPRTSPIHLFGASKIYPPPKVDLDSVPYETIRSIHHPPPHHHIRRHSPPPTHRMMKMESERRSPPRRPRSRSPPMYNGGGYMVKEEPRDFYPRHPQHHHLHQQHHPHSEDKPLLRGLSPRYYPYEVPPPAVIASIPPPIHPETKHPQEASRGSPEHNSKETEPPVYVLPEDFNLKMDQFDPNLLPAPQTASEYEREHQKTNNLSNNNTNKQQQTDKQQTSPAQSAKSNEENQPAPVGEHKLSCKICKQSFPTKSTLYKHLRGHSSDEKPFKCNECGQGFTLSSNLRQHRIIHRGYKPFQCEYCGKKFMRSNVYKQHRRIHTGEQMHKCDLCPSEFLQKYALIKHLKKTHNVETYDN